MNLKHLVIMPEGYHPFPSRTRKLRPPGPMILGAQAPGKVGHRQVNKRKGYLLGDGLFCVSYGSVLGPTLQEHASRVAVWRKSRPLFVPGPMILGAQAPGKVESTRQKYAL